MQYASGRKRGCELVLGPGWPSAGCYVHTSPLVKLANGAPHRFCKILNLPSAERRRSMLEWQDGGEERGAMRAAAMAASLPDAGRRMSIAGEDGRRVSLPDAPVCKLPKPPVVSPYFEVLRDGQGNPLMNNYRYHFRLRSYNGFQPSLVSPQVSAHPIGQVPEDVLGVLYLCARVHTCTHKHTHVHAFVRTLWCAHVRITAVPACT